MIARLSGRLGRNILLLSALLFFGVPVLWLFLATTKTSDQLRNDAPMSFGSFEQIGIAWSHLIGYNDGIIATWTLNSILYTLGSMVIALLACVPAGYGLAKFRFRGRGVVLFLTLVTMVVPSAALILPLYLQMSAVGLTNTPWSVILPLAFYPFGVYLVYLFAATTIPDSVIEAARLDGLSEWGIMMRIFLPLAVPVIVMVAFFAFVNAWNAFFLPYIMLTDSDLANLQTGLQLLMRNTNALGGANFTGIPIREPEIALAAIVSVSPILLIFLFAQRHLVAGQTAGAEKG
ncbi:carbohydrate ABC transporter permease [Microbacterium luteolum]|uniref:Carbohydrate ABC transporter permease n=1 Tax=Microbacterium luteolum TaxID=69367 RepID=A0ABY7XSW0_MICLT|nr:carbohydrate ABC transporter permease [Microbacterium luteolum]WDM45270.1 carbohydrate ABC transporter permease [Microbacterium luteolum]